MAEPGLRCADLYGAIGVINFADMTCRVALQAGLLGALGVIHFGELTHPNWAQPG